MNCVFFFGQSRRHVLKNWAKAWKPKGINKGKAPKQHKPAMHRRNSLTSRCAKKTHPSLKDSQTTQKTHEVYWVTHCIQTIEGAKQNKGCSKHLREHKKNREKTSKHQLQGSIMPGSNENCSPWVESGLSLFQQDQR